MSSIEEIMSKFGLKDTGLAFSKQRHVRIKYYAIKDFLQALTKEYCFVKKEGLGEKIKSEIMQDCFIGRAVYGITSDKIVQTILSMLEGGEGSMNNKKCSILKDIPTIATGNTKEISELSDLIRFADGWRVIRQLDDYQIDLIVKAILKKYDIKPKGEVEI